MASGPAFGTAGHALQRLLEGVDGQQPEAARHAGEQLDLLDPPRRLAAHVVVVIGLAADHRPQAHDRLIAARLGDVLGRQRQLERTRDVEAVYVPYRRLAPRSPRPGLELVG